MVARTGSPDETMRLMKALGILFDSKAKAADRLDALRRITFYTGGRAIGPGILFDEDTIKTSIVWKKLISDDDAATLVGKMDEIRKLDIEEGKKIVEMNKFLGEELQKTVREVFPSIEDKMEWFQKYKKATDAGDIKAAEKILETR